MSQRKERNREMIASFTPPDVCPCPKTGCEHYGNHDACRAHHARKGNLPKCLREK